MKENRKSLKKNYIYSMTLNVLNLLFPLITFPYVSRVLGSDGIGRVSFATSVVQYFTIIGSLGLPLYGIREIAKARNSVEERSKIFTELFIISLIANLVSCIILISLINIVPRFAIDKTLFYVSSINLLLNIFSIDWLFSGLEDYKYITIRSITVKVFSIIFLFLFVNSKEDYILYAIVSVIAISGSNILNAFSLKKFIVFIHSEINIKRHIKPVILIFGAQLATSIYVNLDTTMLGFLSNDANVGYYSSAIKLNRIVIAIVTSLGTVFTPRIAYYIKENLWDRIHEIINFSVKFVLFIAFPSIIGLSLLAPDLILIFSGKDFLPAVSSMKIINPIILIVGLCNITSTQILLPLNREKYVTISVIAGAIVDCFINFILIPLFAHNGAAVATLVAESTVLLIQLYYSRDILLKKIFNKENLKYIFSVSVMALIVVLTKNLVSNIIFRIIFSTIFGATFYVGILLWMNDHISKEIVKIIFKRRLVM